MICFPNNTCISNFVTWATYILLLYSNHISMTILYLKNLHLNIYNFESKTNNLICLNIIGYIDRKHNT